MTNMNGDKQRAIVAEFHKDSGGRLTLFSLTAIQNKPAHDGGTYRSRDTYDVDHSRRYGYIFHQSGAGGGGPIPVSGIYLTSGDIAVEERPTSLVDGNDKSPWRSKKTAAIRKRNRTRRLRAVPKAFDMEPGWDLLDWLEHRAIDAPTVYCSTCNDRLPDTDLCEHCWWCEKKAWYSTPSERCECASRDECEQ
jgi:hypothetical protein